MLHVGGMHMSSALARGWQNNTMAAQVEITGHASFPYRHHDLVELDIVAMCTM